MNSTNENGPMRRGNDDTGPGQPPSREAVIVTDESIQPTTDSASRVDHSHTPTDVLRKMLEHARYERREWETNARNHRLAAEQSEAAAVRELEVALGINAELTRRSA